MDSKNNYNKTGDSNRRTCRKCMGFHVSLLSFISITMLAALMFCGCRNYDGKFDISYSFKTEPEKAVLDFLYSLANDDPDYIYSNLIPDSDKDYISREKYISEFREILIDIKAIEIKKTVYLGFESEMGKVVAEFEVTYRNGESKLYKKYFYLIEENKKWKIIFEKTFI